MAERVAVLETKMEKADAFIANFDKALEVRFRAQAEMLDERFAGVNDQLVLMRRELRILREGMSILLKRRK